MDTSSGRIIYENLESRYFDSVAGGGNTYEFLATRDCRNGDVIIFQKVDPRTKRMTGDSVARRVVYVGPYRGADVAKQRGYIVVTLAAIT